MSTVTFGNLGSNLTLSGTSADVPLSQFPNSFSLHIQDSDAEKPVNKRAARKSPVQVPPCSVRAHITDYSSSALQAW